MKYAVHKDISVPAYIQLYRQVRDDIVKGVYTYNGKLPSKRFLADELGVSTVTVEHAYALLCDEGYVEPRERSGYFVIFRADDGFVLPVDRAVRMVPHHHSDGQVEFPFSVLAKTMRSVISDYGEDILERSEGAGHPILRDAICRYLEKSRGIIADASQIIIGSGAEYLYSLVVQLVGRDRVFAIESPSYNKIEQVYRACDVCCKLLPLGHDGIDSVALRSTTADVLHISPYRSFPSGVTASASKRHEYIRWASENDRLIVEDDFESEFSVLKKTEETLFSHTADDNVIYMNTFSKTLSPSFRTAYMVLPEKLVAVFKQKLGFYSCAVPTYIQLVLAELISGGDFERHINRVRRQKRKQL